MTDESSIKQLPLHVAGELYLCNFFISNAIVRIKCSNSYLFALVKNNDIELVKSLLSENTDLDINAEDENGITALIEACIIGNVTIVEILLENGSLAEPLPGFRHSPLRGASVCGQVEIMSILLKSGASPNALSEGNRTPLMGACFLRNGVAKSMSAKCVKVLLDDERTDITIKNSFGETALDLAKVRGYNDSIILIEEALEQKK